MRALIVVLGFVGFAVSPLTAQERPRHEGFWVGFGLGGGWNVAEEIDGEVLGGGALYVRLGGTVSQKVLLGAEVNGWGRSQGDATLSRGNVTFTVLFYPSRNGGFFLKAGLGTASVTTAVTSGTVTTTDQRIGGGSTIGVGWDIRLGKNLYLTPNIDFLGQVIDGAENSLTLFSLGLTWH